MIYPGLATFLTSWLLVFAWSAPANDLMRLAPSGSAAPSTNQTLPEIRATGPGKFLLGKVRLDQQLRLVEFPAVVNMNTGAVEYLLVSAQGKTHESVLRTDVDPHQLHVAMLLLGATTATNTSARPGTDSALPGHEVEIQVRWGTNTSRLAPAEQLVLNRKTQTTLSPGPWVYTGSRISEGAFVAERDGSIVSIIADLDALVNNPRPGREDDDLWAANHDKIPAVGTPLEVRIRLLPE
jgi:hypothetical protein